MSKLPPIVRIVAFILCIQPNLKAQLVADFSVDVTKGCVPLSIKLTDKSTGNPDYWLWNFGDGRTATNQNPSLAYFSAGSYSISLTIAKGKDTVSITKSNLVQGYPLPVSDFFAQPISGCAPLLVNFTNNTRSDTVGISSNLWDFGDGVQSNVTNPTHIYTKSGLFDITLVAKNNFNCSHAATKTSYIDIKDSISAGFGFQVKNTCHVPYTVQFSDTSKGKNISSWYWDFGDGTKDSTANPLHTYLLEGYKTIKLVVRNSEGCVDSILQKDLIVAGGLAGNFVAPQSTCVGQKVFFENTTQPLNNLDSVRWVFSDGVIIDSLHSTRVFSQAGTYTIRLIVYLKACTDTVVKTMVVQPKPILTFTADKQTGCALPFEVHFTNSTPKSTVVRWEFGNGKTDSSTTGIGIYDAFGTYSVTLTAINDIGCVDTLSIPNFIQVKAPEIVSIKGLPYQGCVPFTNTFVPTIISFEPAIKYLWDFGDGRTSTLVSPNLTFPDTTFQNISLIIETKSGCKDTLVQTFKGVPRPQPNFEGTPLLVCPSTPVVFTNTTTINLPTYNYRWYFGDGVIVDGRQPTHYYIDTGLMRVVMRIYDRGCYDSVVKKDYVRVLPPIAKFGYKAYCDNRFLITFLDSSKGAQLYVWNFGDGTTSNEKNPEHVYKDTGVYKIILSTSTDSCTHTATKTLKILDEKADFEFIDSSVCRQTRFFFRAKGVQLQPRNIRKYQWIFSDGFIVKDTTAFFARVFQSPTNVQLKLIITDLNGCLDSITKTIPIRIFGPKAIFAPQRQGFCAGNFALLTDTSPTGPANPVVKRYWSFAAGRDSVVTVPEVSVFYPTAGNYTIRLVVEDSLKCRDTVTVPNAVRVFKPIPAFSTTDTMVCENALVRFNNTSSGTKITYLWDFGNQITATSVAATTKYPLPGSYDVKLTVRDSIGCTETLLLEKYIRVANAIAKFTVSDSFTSCPPLITNFNNQSQNFVLSAWSFGNGNTSNQRDPKHTYPFVGEYFAQLKVTGNGGCSDSAVQKMIVKGPFGDFRYTPLQGCLPLSVKFASNSKNAKKFTWDYSDGNTTTTVDTTTFYSYTGLGNFLPRLILEDSLGCKVPMLGKDTIRLVGAQPNIKKMIQSVFCDSATIQFFDSTIANDPKITRQWNFGDGTTSTLLNPIHKYNRPGRYTVVLTVFASNGCKYQKVADAPIIIGASPKISISGISNACLPVNLTFQANRLNPDTTTLQWRWDLGGGNTSSKQKTDAVLFNNPASFDIKLVVTDNYGCTGESKFSLIINDTPKVVAGTFTNVCLGKTHLLEVKGALSYVWDVHPSLSCTICNQPFAKPTDDVIYRVVGTDINGCKGADTLLVKVQKPPTLRASDGDTLCIGEKIVLRASGADFFRWSPTISLSDPNVSNPLASPTVSTIYRVLGGDVFNCFTDTLFVPVVVYNYPTINILNDSLLSAPAGAQVVLKGSASSDVVLWRWTPPIGLSCVTCKQPIASINEPITYTLFGSNQGGCESSDQLKITPTCTSENLFIPNTFSPNGDGANEVFYPMGRGIATIRSMRIFNRWGQIVFDRKDFFLNDPSSGWDGTFQGKLLPADVFVYSVVVVCLNNKVFELKGNVTLLR